MQKEELDMDSHMVSIGDWLETVRGEVGEVIQLQGEGGSREIELCVGRCLRHLRPSEIRSIIAVGG